MKEQANEYITKVASLNEAKNLKYYIITMGCQLNENDSEKMCGMTEEMGYTKTNEMKEADLILFNTCCIRENAEAKLFGKLGEAKKIKEEKGTFIAIGGCMMQEDHIIEKLKKSYPFYDVVFGTHTLQNFPADLFNAITTNKKIEDILDIDGEIIEGLPIKRNDNHQALVSIMNGCNNFCTFCIVPYVRGRERSRDPKDILKEVEELAKQGYTEITLLGQNVNSYKGNGNLEIHTFAQLLEAVAKLDGLERVKFMSPHPKDFSDDVIDVIKKYKNISRLIHMPLQSGSSNILKSMNRKYTKEQFISLAKKIKYEIPNAALTTDIIVGFPGETDKDFEDTLDVIKQVDFEQVYMFIYSRRVGTIADKMENQIPEEVKHERFDRLKKQVTTQVEETNKKYIGTVQSILVEGLSKNNKDIYTGRTHTNKIVNFKGDKELIGKMVQIKIMKDHLWYLEGEVI